MKSFARLAWLALGLILAGCGSAGIPHPPSLDLPQPPSDLRIVRKGNRAYLAWTAPIETTDGTNIHHPGATNICRSLDVPITDCGTPVGSVPAATLSTKSAATPSPAKTQATYVDALPSSILSGNPEAELFYRISMMNQRGRSAGLSNSVSIPAFISTPPPTDFQAQLAANGVTLSWAGKSTAEEATGVQRSYRVYRREQGTTSDSVVGEIPLGVSADYRILDQTFEWEMKYEYRVTVLTQIHLPGKSASQFEGDDSRIITVFTHDVFPPAVPSGLQAVFSGAGQQPFIDLIWAPDTDADLAGYNIYRHESGSAGTKINNTLVKPPAFRDANVASGHTYQYTVTAVDVHGNESVPSAEASESVP